MRLGLHGSRNPPHPHLDIRRSGSQLRQFLVESLILAAAGGAAGLLFARAAIAVTIGMIPNAVPRLTETSIGGRVLAFTVAATVLTALVFGVAPAIVLWKASVHDLLKDSARTVSASIGGLRVRQALVAIELALGVVLLIGAGLMVRSFWRITGDQFQTPGTKPRRSTARSVVSPVGVPPSAARSPHAAPESSSRPRRR